MDADQMMTLSLEGSLSLLLIVFAYKLYRMKLKTHSGCCLKDGNGITIDSQNSGVSDENDILDKI